MGVAGRCAVAIFLCVMTSPVILHAQDDDPAKAKASKAFDEAVYLFDGGFYDSALEKFEEAYSYKQHPAILLNIAWCQSMLGASKEALAAFTKYLAVAKDVPDETRDEIESEIEKLEASLCTLNLDLHTQGVSIQVDGQQRNPDLPIVLEMGKHEVVALKDGFTPISQKFTCTPDNRVIDINISMVKPPTTSHVLIKAVDVTENPDKVLSGGTVLIDGANVGSLPLETEVSTGSHKITIVMPGYVTKTRSVTPKAGKKHKVVFKLKPEPSSKGILLIESDSNPYEMLVTIDGKPQLAGGQKFDVSPGTHHVLLESPGYMPWSGDLTLGIKNRLSASLVKEGNPGQKVFAAFTTIGVLAAIATIVSTAITVVRYRETTTGDLPSAAATVAMGSLTIVSFAIVGSVKRKPTVELDVL